MKLIGLLTLALPSALATTDGACPLISLNQVPSGGATKCISKKTGYPTALSVVDCDAGNDGHTWTMEDDFTVRSKEVDSSSGRKWCWWAPKNWDFQEVQVRLCPDGRNSIPRGFRWSQAMPNYFNAKISTGNFGSGGRLLQVWNYDYSPFASNQLISATPRTRITTQSDQSCDDMLSISLSNTGGPTKKCVKPVSGGKLDIVECDPADASQNWSFNSYGYTQISNEQGRCWYYRSHKKSVNNYQQYRASSLIWHRPCYYGAYRKRKNYSWVMGSLPYDDGNIYHYYSSGPLMQVAQRSLKQDAVSQPRHLVAVASHMDELTFEDLI